MESTEATFAESLDWACQGGDLVRDDARAAFSEIISGNVSEVRIAALLAAIRTKGATPDEVAGGVEALQEAMVPLEIGEPGPDVSRAVVDTAGTGGGVYSTFNISTAAAFVARGAGVRVAKHGNRSYTSKCGSADVLEELGIPLSLSAKESEEVMRRAQMVFMYAPNHHPAMRHAARVRRELGFMTIMNLLGPLANPARVRRQVIGVAIREQRFLVAAALRSLGCERALVVHGFPGMDEVSPCEQTFVTEVAGDGSDYEMRDYQISPESCGLVLAEPDSLLGGEPPENAAILRGVLEGRLAGGPRTAVLLNAAAAVYVAGKADSIEDGVGLCEESIDSGAALDALDQLIEASRGPFHSSNS